PKLASVARRRQVHLCSGEQLVSRPSARIFPVAQMLGTRHPCGRSYRKELSMPVLRYRVIKTKDHASPWNDAFVVFDTARTNGFGMFEYVADCVDKKAAKLVADALNAFTQAASTSRRGARRTKALSAKHVAAGERRRV